MLEWVSFGGGGLAFKSYLTSPGLNRLIAMSVSKGMSDHRAAPYIMKHFTGRPRHYKSSVNESPFVFL
jgi:hypothetical protein